MCLKDPSFLNKDQILFYHAEQIRLFGGSAGLRDEGLLESAISAPQNVYCYEDDADIFDLAASYLKSLARNHPFIDGNKRTAANAAISFLKINGFELDTEADYLTLFVERLVTGSCDEIFVADFLFLGCCRKAKNIFRLDSTTAPPPESFKLAKTKEARTAIITDFVTATFRVMLMDRSSALMIRSSRFDGILDHLENLYFKSVDRKWRLQFGMSCEDE